MASGGVSPSSRVVKLGLERSGEFRLRACLFCLFVLFVILVLLFF